jgi:STE24 endopeptidase
MPDMTDAERVDAGRPSTRVAGWVAIVIVLVAGALAQIVRPLAPDLGAVPDPLRWFTPDLLDRIAAYRGPLAVIGVIAPLIDVAVPLAIAATRRGHRFVRRIVALVGPDRPVRAAAAVVAAVVVLTELAHLPSGLWVHRHAVAFGLSTQSRAGWLGDWAIARGVGLLVVTGLALMGWALLRRWPLRWYLAAAPAGVLLVALSVLLSPLLIEPLLYDLRPLPDSGLRRELRAVLAADGRPQAPLLVADASRRTTAQNAYVSGLWGTRRVVLYDTLLERPPEQVAQILAHELAHERNRDVARGVLAGAAGWVVLCGVLAVWVRRSAAPAAHAASGVVAVIAIVVTLSTPVTAWISRRAEAAADIGALELTADPVTFCAMQRGLVERNLSDPAPPTWQRLWSWSHPPAASRLVLAEHWSSAATEGCRRAGPPDPGQGR